jgi:translation initiation factor IF-1
MRALGGLVAPWLRFALQRERLIARGGGVRVKPGDRVEVEAESTARARRAGVVEEVVHEDPPRYRIRWDDGHESVYAPTAGALRKIEASGNR